MGREGDTGPEPLRVLSQTTVIRNGPTYLKLSTLRPSILIGSGGDAPTARTEFLPRELMQNESGCSTPRNESGVDSISSSTTKTQSSGTKVTWGRGLSEGAVASFSPSSGTTAPPSSNQKPSSRSNQKSAASVSQGPIAGPSNPSQSRGLSSSGPSSNPDLPPEPLTVHHQSKKIRRTDIELTWYHSSRESGLVSPPDPKELKHGIAAGYLYLHFKSEDRPNEPTIWIWEVRSDSDQGWVRIEKGHPYPHGDAKRFLAISEQGQPSWNKKVTTQPSEVKSS